MNLVNKIMSFFDTKRQLIQHAKWQVVVWEGGERHEMVFTAEDIGGVIDQLWVEPTNYSVNSVFEM